MSDVGKKKNGKVTLVDVVEQLKGLRDDMGGLRDDLGGLRVDMNRGFDQVNGRIDGVLKNLGGHHRNHERRLTALEKTVAQLKKAS